MIRSVATLFAKKTAVVAVSGVVILGGATLALAADGDQPSTEGTTETTIEDSTTTSTTELESCDVAETTDVVEECETTDTTAPDEPTCDVADTADVVEECETTDTTAPEETVEPDTEELVTEELVTEEDAEESHGDVVSEAARVTCWEQAYLDYYGNHGQCVKTFAHGEGLTLEEVEAAVAAREAAQTPQVTDAAEDDSTSTAVSQSSKPGKGNGGGKPATAGHGGGKGNGKKG